MSKLGQELEHLENIETSSGSSFQSLLAFVKSSLKEINPWHNIKTLHTNV
ncbi:MAG: hypothetical protein ACI9P5_004863, partial [Saprospiraceae bacterium]